jgi:hypothetical protein
VEWHRVGDEMAVADRAGQIAEPAGREEIPDDHRPAPGETRGENQGQPSPDQEQPVPQQKQARHRKDVERADHGGDDQEVDELRPTPQQRDAQERVAAKRQQLEQQPEVDGSEEGPEHGRWEILESPASATRREGIERRGPGDQMRAESARTDRPTNRECESVWERPMSASL